MGGGGESLVDRFFRVGGGGLPAWMGNFLEKKFGLVEHLC